jgi:hypothetical protein
MNFISDVQTAGDLRTLLNGSSGNRLRTACYHETMTSDSCARRTTFLVARRECGGDREKSCLPLFKWIFL